MSDGTPLRLYIDTNILIYVVEGTQPFGSQLTCLLDALDDGTVRGVTSELTIAEVMVKPLASKQQLYIQEYQRLLSNDSLLELRPVDRAVLERSASLRADLGGKLVDGVHVATADLADCKFFLSQDAKIKVPPGIALIDSHQVAAVLAKNQAPS